MTRPWSRIASRSTARSASTTLWVTSRTAAPSSATARTCAQSSRRRTGSTSLVGSSKTTRRPGTTAAMANDTSRLTPPDRRRPSCVRHSPEVQRLDQAVAARADVGRGARRASGRPARSPGPASARRWGPAPGAGWSRRAGAHAGSATRSAPSRRMVPASGRRSPTTWLTSVVLPAPLWPSSPKTSPASTERSTPSLARAPSPVGLGEAVDLEQHRRGSRAGYSRVCMIPCSMHILM